ncbi:two-component sensor histidine kinase [Kitasatospora sp. NE20-6]|uniref:sensor histidine kinase n=1 Tax=Kitasatospora sp. NE20-6 TaxID=2859066 RepID=UPI0034DC8BC3
MSTILAPLVRAATYARWLHLLVGAVFACVVLLVYPGTEGPLGWPALVGVSALLDGALLCLAALIPATRRAEGVQAALLLMPAREDAIGTASSASWADRGRTALWLVARVALGMGVALLTVHGLIAVVGLVRAGGYLLPCAPLLLVAMVYTVALAGRLQLAMAVRLLGPSAGERLAEAEARAERLLERNRLARELHDSIGHALTVSVLQAGAAREVADPAFREKALEAIETTGRRAMEDLERMLVLLRDHPDGPAVEHPGLDRVEVLFETARAAGSPVEARIEVAGARLPGVLSREAYRIVQEGVTNALKHVPGTPVRVHAGTADGLLHLSCATALPAVPQAGGRRSGGKGLRGIRERAALLGGEAVAGPVDGDWVVRVRLPLRLGS